MRKVSILSAITASIISGVFFFNSEVGAQDNSIANGLPKEGNSTSAKKQENNYYVKPKVNNLFKWALNPVEVNLSSGNNFTIDNGVIKRQDNEVYIIPYKTGKLKVSSKDYSQEFEVLSLPDAQFKIGGEIKELGSQINLSKIMENGKIDIYFGKGIVTDFGVSEYSIYFNQDKKDEEKFVVQGDILSTKEIELIKRGLKDGKNVSLDYITLRMPDGFVNYNGIYYIVNK